jgi:hypothetical protein
MITSKANAQRAHNIGNGQTVYEVILDGRRIDAIVAKSLPEANGIVRRALKSAYKSVYNQTLIFRGDLAEGEVSSVQMRTALSKIAK